LADWRQRAGRKKTIPIHMKKGKDFRPSPEGFSFIKIEDEQPSSGYGPSSGREPLRGLSSGHRTNPFRREITECVGAFDCLIPPSYWEVFSKAFNPSSIVKTAPHFGHFTFVSLDT
jgi:hypothetical protein